MLPREKKNMVECERTLSRRHRLNRLGRLLSIHQPKKERRSIPNWNRKKEHDFVFRLSSIPFHSIVERVQRTNHFFFIRADCYAGTHTHTFGSRMYIRSLQTYAKCIIASLFFFGIRFTFVVVVMRSTPATRRWHIGTCARAHKYQSLHAFNLFQFFFLLFFSFLWYSMYLV